MDPGIISVFDPRVVSPCCKESLFNLDFKSQRSFCFMPTQPAAWWRSSLLLLISFWLAYLRPKAKSCSPHTPHPLLFLCHPSGVPVVHFLVLPGLTAVSLCLDGCTSFLTIMKEALAMFSLAWLPCFPNCRTLNRPTATHLERLNPWLWISTLHISFDSLMGRIIYSCFNLCFTYWWLWSSFPCLCLEQMLDLLGFERSGVSVIFQRDTLCHFHIDF